MKTNREKSKQYEFCKLCISLTKQGFRFTRYENEYLLIFDLVDYRRLLHPETKLPFVNSITHFGTYGKSKFMCYLNQWAD